MIKKILLALAVILIIMQFFTIDKSVPETNPAIDFMNVTSPTSEVATILKNGCYDCHSYNTKYPWYSNVAPVSWWVKDHIDHGRDELNFSLWGSYSAKRADHKLEESSEMVLEEEMPLPSYTWIHGDAKLSTEERTLLANWFDELRATMVIPVDSTEDHGE
tara:strand:- start:170 stop:652 length:483 start_codon:yes stop_codon:yes gene_type:complete